MILKNCKRLLYKISGECLMGTKSSGYCNETMHEIAEDIKNVHNMGLEICLVIGGGNIYRGVYGEEMGMDRSVADYMGMLATVMNAIALQNILEKCGLETRVQSAIPLPVVAESYINRRAKRHLEKGRIVLFAAGTGNPFFTTDTTAILRTLELSCDYMFKGTSVNGIYSDDPKKNSHATKFDKISHQDLIEKNLKVMDITAVSMARDRKIPIVVFSMKQHNALTNVINEKCDFTIVTS